MQTLSPRSTRHHSNDFNFELPIHEIGLNPNAREWYPMNAAPSSGSSSSQQYFDSRKRYSNMPRQARNQNQASRRHSATRQRKGNDPPVRSVWGKRHRLQQQEARAMGESAQANNRRQQKFGYRSKQNKIDAVLTNLQNNLAHLITCTGEKLRGPDTVRIDVKRFSALQNIERLLEKVEEDETINIIKADFPVSQKNRFQKKGFIAYIKCATVEEAERLRTFIEVKGRGVYRVKIALEKTSDLHADNATSPSSSSGSSEREELTAL